ncbi:MAG: hypothetical protein KBF89_07715 [Acidimicrobiia bacterium]|nr:hypothetical protein [Acidimicrobiia bacterium]
MTNIEPEVPAPTIGHVKIVYYGPVHPHWGVEKVFGDDDIVESFRQRVGARLNFVPPHDPQFRRNRERVVKDGEREGVVIQWDLGFDDESDA